MSLQVWLVRFRDRHGQDAQALHLYNPIADYRHHIDPQASVQCIALDQLLAAAAHLQGCCNAARAITAAIGTADQAPPDRILRSNADLVPSRHAYLDGGGA